MIATFDFCSRYFSSDLGEDQTKEIILAASAEDTEEDEPLSWSASKFLFGLVKVERQRQWPSSTNNLDIYENWVSTPVIVNYSTRF